MLQVARISINPSINWVSNSFNQLILEKCMMKMESKRALKIECIIRMEEPVLGETVNGRLINSIKALAT